MGLLVACPAPSNMSHANINTSFQAIRGELTSLHMLWCWRWRKESSQARDWTSFYTKAPRRDRMQDQRRTHYVVAGPARLIPPSWLAMCCYSGFLLGRQPSNFVFDRSDNDLVAGYISGELHSTTAGWGAWEQKEPKCFTVGFRV